MPATPIAAELEGTPRATFSVFPGLVPSDFTLPGPSRLPLPRTLRRAATIAAAVSGEDGLQRAVDAIERLLA